MIRLLRYPVAALSCCLAFLPAEEKPRAIVLPAEFEDPSSPVADAENGIVLFMKAFKVPVGEEMERYGDSLELLKSGKPLEDPRFLDEFRQTYELGRKFLKPPLRFPGHDSPHPNIAPFLRLFQATEILARNALLEGDRQASDRYLADAISWSKLLRSAHPTMIDAVISEYGWRETIGLQLEDWQGHDDQRKRLDQLLPIFRDNRIEVEELVGIAKAEARWWAAQGGLREYLKQPGYGSIAQLMLNERFEGLTHEVLFSLPFDLEADSRRDFNQVAGQIRGLRQGIPALRWPGVSKPVVNRTLEDYRKLPNGLGDLFYEQEDNFPGGPMWIDGLCRQRLLDACLIWLKRERDGLDVTADSFKELTDPISGEALDVDLERRVIRCRGWDGKAAPLDLEKLKPGFHDEADDFFFVVPRWKERK
jgi:hypothetical protein